MWLSCGRAFDNMDSIPIHSKVQKLLLWLQCHWVFWYNNIIYCICNFCTLLLVKHVVLLCKFVYEWSENEVHICGLHKSLLHPLKQSKINIYKNEVVTFPLKLWRVFKDTPFLMAKESNRIGKVRHLLVKIKYN